LPRAMPSYTQGVMDLGATVCLPKRPTCMLCPVNDMCAARKQGTPEHYPVKTRKLHRSAEALWMLRAEDAEGRVWLTRRPARGIWAGLYCLPVFADRDALLEALPRRAQVRDEPPFLHVLTHKDLHLHPVSFRGEPATKGEGAWFEASAWHGLGLPAPVRKLLLQAPSSSR